MNKNKVKLLLLSISCFISGHLSAQTAPFEISIQPLNINGLGGLQSYAFGQHQGKWLIVGGRLDGLHRRQPFATFDTFGHNNQLIVIDPINQKHWSAPLTTLSAAIQEQMRSTNMQFYQEGEFLYCVGGYGYSALASDHVTFKNFTAIQVPDVINAVINKTSFTNYFTQISDPLFQVTGGKLKKIDSTFYLLGGQKFMGRYNPMGPNHGPGFTQEYTNSIRKFTVSNNSGIQITHLNSYTDATHLHRRDYNAEPQILSNGKEGITLFSGVFQPAVNLPFLTSVTVDSDGYALNDTFKQYYNHYHCPVLPIYSEKMNEMHSVFFGGIAQYYDNAGTLVQDNNVPFVNTIARVTRNANGTMSEYKLPVEMPSLLGAGAEFIPNLEFPHYKNGVFKLDSLSSDSALIGYIYGGISSTLPNIFFINNGTQSDASNALFKVYVKPSNSMTVDQINVASTNALNLTLSPNPTFGEVHIAFHLTRKENVTIQVFDGKGALVKSAVLQDLMKGQNHYTMNLKQLSRDNIYYFVLEKGTEKITQKLILKR